ncbi:MAG: sugar kinase [Deltaproteobacteria bacterium]|nr:sugar kinase [Deltaproteobacteria bacterium]
MLAVIGTIPDTAFPMVKGEVFLENEMIRIRDRSAPVNWGTAALIAAAVKTSEFLGQSLPFACLAGDIGLGKGSRRIYQTLVKEIGSAEFTTIVFHYLQPDVDWHNKVLFAIDDMSKRPILIADAGFMYAAKMSGQAGAYDLFTPDIGELAFLADEKAPHPFYTRGFILHEDNRASELISRAYANENAARYLLVKGREDYLADHEGILANVKIHINESMEAIGGTGDTLTGIVAALVESGMKIKDAAITAAKVNRLAGYNAKPTPATQVTEIINHIPSALSEILRNKKTAAT